MPFPPEPTVRPTDPTQTNAWKKLSDHYNTLKTAGISMRDWFAQDPSRVQEFTSVSYTHLTLPTTERV